MSPAPHMEIRGVAPLAPYEPAATDYYMTYCNAADAVGDAAFLHLIL